MSKQSLNAFKLIQLRFNKFQHGFQGGGGGGGGANDFDSTLQQNRMDVEANVEAVCSVGNNSVSEIIEAYV